MLNKILAVAAVSAAVVGCSSAPKLQLDNGSTLYTADKVYTQTNLHPDEVRRRLYSINYQQAGLIPRCTEVTIKDASAKKMIFEADGTTYHYFFHKASGSFDDNIKKYFGPACKKSDLRGLNSIDKKGLKEGKVLKGMTKDGVILAIGHPPAHVTPSLKADVWKYWSNRFNTFNVVFDKKGRVKRVQD